MNEFWNKVYKSDNSFFGDDPSKFAIRCYNHMKENNPKKILELGSGHGRDTLFFASNGLEVDALDYSDAAIEILDKMAKEKRLPIKAKVFDVNNQLPFPDATLMQYTHICFLTWGFHYMNFILYFQK